ncbi:MAG: hypothetical protein J6C37_02860, partial [Roseburia sp.]|nr:hypothetical protein [Roseburia sp.]
DEQGVTCIKPIGESETTEGRLARGASNIYRDFFNSNAAYEYVNSYSSGEDILKTIPRKDFAYNTYSGAPTKVLNTESSDSDYSIIRERIGEIIKNYQTQMILAKDEAAFEALYQECLDVIQENDLDKLKEYVLGLSKDYIAEMEAMGVEFQ